MEVLSPAEKPTRHGLIYAATPASDIVCGPCQLASGIRQPYSDRYGFHKDLCIFNPAPIT